MRFLHTADWHVGKPLRGRSRMDEQEAAAREILDIARRERVDCVLVAGDLFDSQAPPPDAERLVYSFFAELLGAGMIAVVIGGNHDHPKRLAAVRELLDRLRIYIRPEPAAPAAGGVIDVVHDGQSARIAVLPFLPEKKIVDVCRLLAPEDTWYAEYAENVAAMCQRLAESFSAATVNVLMAHVFVSGANTSGSERAIHVAQPYAVSARRFPASAHYIALGHLHRPQEIASSSPCFYAGSPLQLDFGEQGQSKRVLIVDAQPGRPARVESISLTAGRRLQDTCGTLEELRARAGDFGTDFLRVTVQSDARVPGLTDRVRELLPNAVDVRADYPRTEAEPEPPQGLSPDGMFAAFYEAQYGSAPPGELQRLFAELHHEVIDEAG